MHWRTSYFIPPAAALIMMILLYFSFGFFFESYETILSALFHADIANPPYDDWPSPGHFMIAPFLGFLGQLLPNVPVYGLWLCFLNFLWLIALVRLWQVVFKEHLQSFNLFSILSLLLMFLLLSESVIYLSITRASILLCSVTMLLHYYDGGPSRKRKVAYFSLYILGAITRLHAVIFVMLILTVFFLIQREPFKNILLKFYPHVLIIGLFFTVYYVDILTTNNLGKTIEWKYEYAIVDKQSFYPIGDMKTKSDTAKYYAITQFFLTDSLNINKEILSNVVKTKAYFTALFSYDRVSEITPLLKEIWQRYWGTICALFLIMVLAASAAARKIKVLTRAVPLIVAFVILILALTIAVNMFDRLFSPLLALLFLCCLIICLPKKKLVGKKQTIWLVLIIGIAATFSVFEVRHLEQISRAELAREDSQKVIHDGLAQVGAANTVMAYNIHEDFFTNNPFKRTGNGFYNQVIFPDIVFFTYYKFGQQRLIDKYGFSPLDYKGTYKFLKDNQHDLIIFTYRGKTQLLTYYFRSVYGYNVTFKEVNQSYFQPPFSLFRVVI